MKKLIVFATIVLTFLFTIVAPKNILIEAATTTEEVSASYSNFNQLPNDWSLYQASDVANTSLAFDNNEIVITNQVTTSNSLYYGSVYYVDTNHIWKDFTFEVNMKMTRADDNNRWFGIGYHTQEVAGNMIGYLMNYRYGGDSAFSAFNSSRAFYDGDKVNSQNTKLNDGNYHTLKVKMQGNIASHYIDDKLVVSWDVRDRNTHLGGNALTSGGFALFVNR